MGIARIARALGGRQVEPAAELVFWLNGLVSLAVGAASWIKFDLAASAAAALAIGVFLVLLASLLHPNAAALAGALGSLTSGAIGALIGASLGLGYGGTSGAWVGGVLGGGALLVVAASAYIKLVRAASRSRTEAPMAGGGGSPASSDKLSSGT